MRTDLENNAVAELLRTNRFYAELLLKMEKVYTTDSNMCPSIGVQFTKTNLRLIINSNFISQFSVVQLAGIFAHECEHPARNHFERASMIAPNIKKVLEPEQFNKLSILEKIKLNQEHNLINQAQDYAINQDIRNLPRTWKLFDIDGSVVKNKDGSEFEAKGCFLENLRQDYPNQPIESGQASEYYYGLLKRLTKDNQQNSYMCIDVHSFLEDSIKELGEDQALAVLKKVFNEAADSCSNNLSSENRQLLDKLNQSAVDWKKELRLFKNSCSSLLREETRKRRNRRYGLLYPGKRTKDTTHIVVALDSSGSTSDYWSIFFAEIASIAQSDIKITFIECDSVVRNVIEYNKNYVPQIIGGGGTSFRPVFDLVSSPEFEREHTKIDGLIYLTDGEDFDTVEKPGFEVLWALTPNGKSRYSWGHKIYIKDENEQV
jgi:predicted metal-dependent peptidase